MNGNDLTMMARCIELSQFATIQRELPFACVICKDGDIVVEATNRVKRDADVTRTYLKIADRCRSDINGK